MEERLSPIQLAHAFLEDNPDSIPEYGILILRTLDQGGEEHFKYRIFGDPDVAGMVGLIRVVENSLLHRDWE